MELLRNPMANVFPNSKYGRAAKFDADILHCLDIYVEGEEFTNVYRASKHFFLVCTIGNQPGTLISGRLLPEIGLPWRSESKEN